MANMNIGKDAYHRNAAERELDLMEMTPLYLRSHSFKEIADILSMKRPYRVTPSMMQTDAKTLHERWKREYLADYDAIKARELRRIDELEFAYWEAWERSKSKQEEVISERTEDQQSGATGDSFHNYTRSRAKKRERTRDGDREFLRGIQWCIEERAKVYGFYAPTRVSFDWRKQAEEAGLDPGEIFNEIVGKYVEAASVDGDGGSRSLDGSTADSEE